MSKEKTLNEIGKEAAAHYHKHDLSVARARGHAKSLAQVSEGRTVPEVVRRYAKTAASAVKHLDGANENARKFAQENAADLHDLAVIEAHLGGVAINIEQPITIGEKITVHYDEVADGAHNID